MLGDGGIDALKRQLTALEVKVNSILEVVSRKAESPVPVATVVPETIKAGKAPIRKAAKKLKK